LAEGGPDDGAVGQVDAGTLLGYERHEPLRHPPAAPPRHLQVVHDLAGVRLRVAGLVQPAPGPVGAGQGGLDQILGQVLIAGEQVGAAQQRRCSRADELLVLVDDRWHGAPFGKKPSDL